MNQLYWAATVCFVALCASFATCGLSDIDKSTSRYAACMAATKSVEQCGHP